MSAKIRHQYRRPFKYERAESLSLDAPDGRDHSDGTRVGVGVEIR